MKLCLDRLEFLHMVTTSEARKLRSRGLIPPSAEDEIVDELVFEVVVRLSKFDESRGSWEAYVNVVVRSKLVSIVRRLRAAKRDFMRDRSLGDRDLIDHDTRDGGWQRAVDLRLDIEWVLLSFDERERALAMDLVRKPLAALSEETGIPRRTLRDHKDRLRDAFAARGLSEYVNPPASAPRDCVDVGGASASRGEAGVTDIDGDGRPEGGDE